MSTPTQAMTAQKALTDTDPTLANALRKASSVEQFVQTALAGAQRHGVVLNAHVQLQTRLSQAVGDPAGGELTDRELAGVAGGGSIGGYQKPRKSATDVWADLLNNTNN